MRVRLLRWHAGVRHSGRAGEHIVMGDLVNAVATRALVQAFNGIQIEFVLYFGCLPIRSVAWRRSWT